MWFTVHRRHWADESVDSTVQYKTEMGWIHYSPVDDDATMKKNINEEKKCSVCYKFNPLCLPWICYYRPRYFSFSGVLPHTTAETPESKRRKNNRSCSGFHVMRQLIYEAGVRQSITHIIFELFAERWLTVTAYWPTPCVCFVPVIRIPSSHVNRSRNIRQHVYLHKKCPPS